METRVFSVFEGKEHSRRLAIAAGEPPTRASGHPGHAVLGSPCNAGSRSMNGLLLSASLPLSPARRPAQESRRPRWRALPYGLPPFGQRRHPGQACFRGSMAGLCVPLPTPSRMPAHGLGPMWFATPSSWRTCTAYCLPVSRRTQSQAQHSSQKHRCGCVERRALPERPSTGNAVERQGGEEDDGRARADNCSAVRAPPRRIPRQPVP